MGSQSNHTVMVRVNRDTRQEKIKELRLKHRDPKTGAMNTDAGTPYDLEYIEWLKEQELVVDYKHLSRLDNREYFDSNKAYRNVSGNSTEQLALWEDDALIALSLENQESIEMAKASKEQWTRNMRVVSKQFARQARAFSVTEAFQGEIYDAWSDEEKTAKEVAVRLKLTGQKQDKPQPQPSPESKRRYPPCEHSTIVGPAGSHPM